MSLDMFLFILWPFESFPTKFAPMWLQRNVNADMRRDVIPLDDFNLAVTPSTDQIQVIGTFTPNVDVAYMILVWNRKSVPRYISVRTKGLKKRKDKAGGTYR